MRGNGLVPYSKLVRCFQSTPGNCPVISEELLGDTRVMDGYSGGGAGCFPMYDVCYTRGLVN